VHFIGVSYRIIKYKVENYRFKGRATRCNVTQRYLLL